MKLLKTVTACLILLLLCSCSTPEKDNAQIALKGMPKDVHEAMEIERLRYSLIEDDFTLRGKRDKEIAKENLDYLEKEYEVLKNTPRSSSRYSTVQSNFVLAASQCKSAVNGFYEMNEGLPLQLTAIGVFIVLFIGGLLFFIVRKKKKA